MNAQAKGATLVMGAGFFWGTFGIFTKLAYAWTPVGPISLAWLRLIVALPIFAALVALKGHRISLTRHELALFIGFGFFSLTIFEVLYFTSLAYTTVQHAAALLYTAPAFVAIFSWLILKERFNHSKILAVILSITGAFLMVGVLRGEPLFASRTQIGDWLAVGSGLAYSSWYIFGKILGRDREPVVTTFIGLCFGVVFLIPLVMALENFHLPQDLVGWSLVAAIGIIPTSMAYMFYLSGLKLIEATRASVFAITEPVTAAILASLFFGETLSVDSFLGFILIISSIILISFRKK